MITEKEILLQLRKGQISLAPLSMRVIAMKADTGRPRFDATIEVEWGGKSARFAVECKALSTPKSFQTGLLYLKGIALPKGYLPMLIVPFLGEGQLRELERAGISGLDLCGNGVVVAPGKFSVYRTGGKNLFPSGALIKNIYRRNSSLVGRVFLAAPLYTAVQEIHGEINKRNLLVRDFGKTPMSLSTVSKALKTLDEDLIVARENNIRLLQPDKLLEKLAANYSPPNVNGRVSFKTPDGNKLIGELTKQSRALGLPLIATGASSAGRYAVMQGGNVLSVYCPEIGKLLERLPGRQTDRFPNLELIETDDETVFFDARKDDDFPWASPVQTYLELIRGDKRDMETAEQVKSFILKTLERNKP